MQQEPIYPGPGGQSPAGAGQLQGAPTPGQPELPMPQIADRPPESVNPADLTHGVPDASTSASSRPIEYWLAELDQVLIREAQNPKQKADTIAAMKRQYQSEILGINLPGGAGSHS